MPRIALLLASGAVLLLGGYMTPAERQRAVDAQDDARCRSYGAVPGSDAYMACRMQAAQIQAQQDAAQQIAASNMMIAGAAMMSQPLAPPPAPSGPPGSSTVQTAPICSRGPYGTVYCR